MAISNEVGRPSVSTLETGTSCDGFVSWEVAKIAGKAVDWRCGIIIEPNIPRCQALFGRIVELFCSRDGMA
ncbi:hypothetical protein T02_6198 [Trichinella nativa]|uniref:Uncharacterized protein n=1 Tax=Trichinella nativa TaxID=6335 RepID=A0A0V1L4F7_9BILA|nr:hypothetical protein T02_6198 [Trichinella nativa]